MVLLSFSLLSLILGFSIINYNGNKDRDKYLCFFIALILSMVSGFRYDVGMDFHVYEFLYNNPNNPRNMFIEPVWITFASILHYFNLPSVVWFLLTSISINFLIIYSIERNSKNLCLSIILYIVALQYYFQSMNIVRQYFAIAIIFGFIDLYLNKKYIQFLAVIIISSFFHPSALLSIPFFIVCLIDINDLILFFLLFVSFLIKNKTVDLVKVILGKISNYGAYLDNLVAAKTTTGLYAASLLLIGILLIYRFHNEKDDKIIKLKNMSICSFCIYMMFSTFEAGQRINLYFFPGLLPLISYIPTKKKFNETVIITGCIIVLFFLFFIKATSNVPYNIR